MGFKNKCDCFWNGRNWIRMCDKHRDEAIDALREYHNIPTNKQVDEEISTDIQQSLFN